MKIPEADSKRTKRKEVRGVQTNSPDTNKRCHKRAVRRIRCKEILREKHLKRSDKIHYCTEPGSKKYK